MAQSPGASYTKEAQYPIYSLDRSKTLHVFDAYVFVVVFFFKKDICAPNLLKLL